VLDAGANPATVTGWIAETEAQKASYALVVVRKPAATRHRMTEPEIKVIVDNSMVSEVRLHQKAKTRYPALGVDGVLAPAATDGFLGPKTAAGERTNR
jgi:hypothetical protein